MEIRSFLAFELPADIKQAVLGVSEDLRRSPLEARWVKGENIHLTVVFLGNMRKDRLKALGEAVEEVCLAYGPFSIELKGMGCFPNLRNPRVLWLGLDGDLGRLSSFRDALQDRLGPFGIKEEKRPFRPHLTLGRFRGQTKREARPEEWISGYGDPDSPACTLKELVLFKSTLSPRGARYDKMASWPLAGKK